MGAGRSQPCLRSRALASHECAGVPQLYLAEAAGDKRLRPLGFEGAVLKSGESTGREAERGTVGASALRLGHQRVARGRMHLLGAFYGPHPVNQLMPLSYMQTLGG